MKRRTQIICSIGPASRDRETLRKLVEAGLDWARLNFSHGSREEHAEVAGILKDLSKQCGRQVKLLADLEGPKLRIGALEETLELKTGQEIVILAGFARDPGVVPVPDVKAFKALNVGTRLYLDDGAVELKIDEAMDALRYHAVVTAGGHADSCCGLTLHGREPDLPALSERDLMDVEAGKALGADAFAQSMVRCRGDVDLLQGHLGPNGRIVAKIESPAALIDLERIAVGSWGLMVARGDLGVNIPRAQVPVVQKEILELCSRCSCFSVVATQLLLSMVRNRRPNRAEVSDVAGAILDGVNAVMLSEETSIGCCPVEVVREAVTIIETVEASRWYRR